MTRLVASAADGLHELALDVELIDADVIGIRQIDILADSRGVPRRLHLPAFLVGDQIVVGVGGTGGVDVRVSLHVRRGICGGGGGIVTVAVGLLTCVGGARIGDGSVLCIGPVAIGAAADKRIDA